MRWPLRLPFESYARVIVPVEPLRNHAQSRLARVGLVAVAEVLGAADAVPLAPLLRFGSPARQLEQEPAVKVVEIATIRQIDCQIKWVISLTVSMMKRSVPWAQATAIQIDIQGLDIASVFGPDRMYRQTPAQKARSGLGLDVWIQKLEL